MAASPALVPPGAARRAVTRPAMASRAGAALLCLGLLLAALGAVGVGNTILALFPERLALASDGRSLTVTVDGAASQVPLDRPISAIWFVPVAADHREYQIDGSDSTNNFTFDPEYFAREARSPYYRLQALLRDEGGYSRWQDLIIRDGTGAVLLRQATPQEGSALSVPARFQCSVDLERLETPRAIQLLDDQGGALELTLNRNDKYVRLSSVAGAAQGEELARQYFPLAWQPAAAGLTALLLRGWAIALALTLLLVLPALVLPAARVRPSARAAACLAVLAALFALGASSYGALALFGGLPHIFDGISYYVQARIFAAGALAAPTPSYPDAFPDPFFVNNAGRWFSQYPPGTPLVLALGFKLGVPWLVEPLLAAAAVLLTFAVGRLQYSATVAALAALLMALSPFLLLQAGTYMSHVPALAFATLALYAVTRYRERPASRWALLAAVALGLTLLSREITAVLYGIALAAAILVRPRAPAGRVRWRDVALAAGTLALFAAAYLGDNALLTGSPLLLPRGLFNPGDRFGFGPGIGFYGRHTLASGLVNTSELLTSLTYMLFGWPYGVALGLMALPFLLWRARGWDWFHGALVTLFVLAYIGYFYHGIAFGPRYYAEAIPAMALLTARGVQALAETLAALLVRWGRGGADRRGRSAAFALILLLIGCNVVYFMPRQVQLYRGFSGLPGGQGPALSAALREAAVGHSTELRGAVVATTQWWYYAVYLAPLNCPRLDCATLFAYAPDPGTVAALQAAYPQRRWFWIEDDNDTLEAVPEEQRGE